MAAIPRQATIIGGPISPYVRKVLAACELKGVPYRLDPIVPFFGDDRFTALSPLRRIPVFIDGEVSLCDSTVICEYLDECYPSPPLLPGGPVERARARWIEEYADTRLGAVAVWRIFYPAVVLPFVFGKERDKEGIAKAVAEELPKVMDDLERVAPGHGFVCGSLSRADIAVAAFFCNLRWARVVPEATRWPKACAWVARTLAISEVAKVTAYGDRLMQVPPGEHRAALAALGVRLTEETFAGDRPQRGPMIS